MAPTLTIIIPLEPSSNDKPKGLVALAAELSCECEVMLLDWRTPKGTLEFAKESLSKHHSTHILTLPDDIPAGKVFNSTIREAHGEYITFMDPNDEPTPRAIERILNNIAQKKNVDLLLLSASIGKLDEDNFFIPQFHKRTLDMPGEGSGLRLLEKIGRNHGFLKCELFLGCYKRSFLLEHELFVHDDLKDLMALEWLPRVFFYANHCSTLQNKLPCWWDFNKPEPQFIESQRNYLDALPCVILFLANFFNEHHGEMPPATCEAWAETTFHPLLRRIYNHTLPNRKYDREMLQNALAKLWGKTDNTQLLENLIKHLSFKKRFFLALMRRFAKSGSETLPKFWAKLFLR